MYPIAPFVLLNDLTLHRTFEQDCSKLYAKYIPLDDVMVQAIYECSLDCVATSS